LFADQVGFYDVEVVASVVVVVFQGAAAGAQGVQVGADFVVDALGGGSPGAGQAVELPV
jgi:hypothetical protein